VSRSAVFGAGSWGTAFSMILADAGGDVALWSRRRDLADTINASRENPDYLPGVEMPPRVNATTDVDEAVDGAEIVVLAVPAQTLRENLEEWQPHLPRDAVIVSLMKGVEVGTAKRMSEVILELTDADPSRVAVVTGPNLAKEIGLRQPAASVVACIDESVAERLQKASHTEYFRPYTNVDVVGCELGGAVKNVIALAVGMAVGMGFGDNSKATIITRGLAETERLGRALGADAHTFAGLAGMGDLVATCTSPLSRNRTFGENLGKGMSLDEAVATSKETAEGIKSCSSILELARRHDVDMPITEHVVGVVHDGLDPREMVKGLMTRSAKAERDV
jgi:glycerol-3-phosphate dehydrogenase (NAD(P)+)